MHKIQEYQTNFIPELTQGANRTSVDRIDPACNGPSLTAWWKHQNLRGVEDVNHLQEGGFNFLGFCLKKGGHPSFSNKSANDG